MQIMKHRLALEALTVQSFSPEPPPDPVGDGDVVYAAPSYLDFTRCQTDCDCPPHW
jgi:hypothetical protein